MKATSTKTVGGRIKYVRELNDLTQAEFATRLDTSRGAIGNWELGKGIKTANLMKIADRFRVPSSWLIDNRGDAPTMRADMATSVHIDSDHILPPDRPKDSDWVRVVGYVGAGGERHLYAVGQEAIEKVPPTNASAVTVAVEIRGVSAGKHLDRWLAFYEDVRSPVTPDLFGEPCVVGLSDDRVMLKIIKPRNGHFDLLSLNPEEPTVENVKIEWAALVTSFGRKR